MTIFRMSRSIFRFLLITFLFMKIFQKFQSPSPIIRPFSTILYLWFFNVSRLLGGENWGFSQKPHEICDISRYFTENVYLKKSRFSKLELQKFYKSKVVDQGRFLAGAWNFWKILKNGRVMAKKRNSEIFEKSSLHQWKINLRFWNLENLILREKLA